MNKIYPLFIDKLISASEMEGSSFVLHLLNKLPRTKFLEMCSTSEGWQYVPKKDLIIFPYFHFTEFEVHQIAHMVEMPVHRSILPDWGMKNFGIYTPSDKGFFTALVREIRVRTIATIIGYSNNANLFSQNNIFGNKFWSEETKKRLPFGKFKNFAEVQQWADHIRDRTISDWNPDKVETFWNDRMNFLSNWVETIEKP